MCFDRYYHVYRKVTDELFSRVGLIKVLNENDDSLIESWCKQKLGDEYITKGGKLIKC